MYLNTCSEACLGRAARSAGAAEAAAARRRTFAERIVSRVSAGREERCGGRQSEECEEVLMECLMCQDRTRLGPVNPLYEIYSGGEGDWLKCEVTAPFRCLFGSSQPSLLLCPPQSALITVQHFCRDRLHHHTIPRRPARPGLVALPPPHSLTHDALCDHPFSRRGGQCCPGSAHHRHRPWL